MLKKGQKPIIQKEIQIIPKVMPSTVEKPILNLPKKSLIKKKQNLISKPKPYNFENIQLSKKHKQIKIQPKKKKQIPIFRNVKIKKILGKPQTKIIKARKIIKKKIQTKKEEKKILKNKAIQSKRVIKSKTPAKKAKKKKVIIKMISRIERLLKL